MLLNTTKVANAQKQEIQYQITGTYPSAKGNAVVHFRTSTNGKPVKDSCFIHNGEFNFKGIIDEPKVAVLILVKEGGSINSPDRDLLSLFLDRGKILITVKDSLRNAVVRGSGEDIRFRAFAKAIKPVIKNYEAYNTAKKLLEKNIDTGGLVSLQNRLLHLKEIEALVIEEFVNKNKTSFVSLYAINSASIGNSANPFVYENIFHLVNDKIKQSSEGKKLFAKIQNAQNQFTLAAIPDFIMKDTTGTSVSIKSIGADYILIDFWASWCIPCREQVPALKKVYAEFRQKGFEIIAVSLDKRESDWMKAIKDDQATWVQLSDLKGTDNAMAKYFGIAGIPANLLIDKEGHIIERNIDIELLIEKLKLLFARL